MGVERGQIGGQTGSDGVGWGRMGSDGERMGVRRGEGGLIKIASKFFPNVTSVC